MFDSLTKCPLSFCYSIALIFFAFYKVIGMLHFIIPYVELLEPEFASVTSNDILVVCFFSYFVIFDCELMHIRS